MPVSRNQAVTIPAIHHNYVRTQDKRWDYSELNLDWHLNQQATLSLSTSHDWFGRGFETFTLTGAYEQPLAAQLKAIIEGGVVNLERRAHVNSLEFAKLSIQHQHQRWTNELSIILRDAGQGLT